MCRESWVPTVPQIVMASERTILAVLDTSLELAARTLLAEHAALEENARRGATEPPPPCEAMAASILILARSLRELISGYCCALEHIHGDRENDQENDCPF